VTARLGTLAVLVEAITGHPEAVDEEQVSHIDSYTSYK
jgi:hypothetical protein